MTLRFAVGSPEGNMSEVDRRTQREYEFSESERSNIAAAGTTKRARAPALPSAGVIGRVMRSGPTGTSVTASQPDMAER